MHHGGPKSNNNLPLPFNNHPLLCWLVFAQTCAIFHEKSSPVCVPATPHHPPSNKTMWFIFSRLLHSLSLLPQTEKKTPSNIHRQKKINGLKPMHHLRHLPNPRTRWSFNYLQPLLRDKVKGGGVLGLLFWVRRWWSSGGNYHNPHLPCN